MLTNKHVVGATPVGTTVVLRPVVVRPDNSVVVGEPKSGTVRFKHPDLDVAVIEIATSVSPAMLLPVAGSADQHTPRGTELYAHGFPAVGSQGAPGVPTLSRGMLSAHYPDPITGEVFYLTDTALSPGSSGGPVTDPSGAVIGIATAVSIVVDGAGTSWGYVLPIRAIDKALNCSGGLATLPKPFDPSRHIAAIRACSTPDKAAEAHCVGIDDAIKGCAGGLELAAAVRAMDDALLACRGVLQTDRAKAFLEAGLRSQHARLTHLFELTLLDTDQGELVASQLFGPWVDERFAPWVGAVVDGAVGSVPAKDQALATVGMFSQTVALMDRLLTTVESDCAVLGAATTALDSKSAIRKDVKSFAKAMSSLVLAYARLQALDQLVGGLPEAGNPDLPSEVRKPLRAARSSLQDFKDKWIELPEDCRNNVAVITAALLEEPDGAAPPDEVPGLDSLPANGDPMETAIAIWRLAGFTTLGAVRQGTTGGGEGRFTLEFRQAPAMIWIGVQSPDPGEVEITVTDARGRSLPVVGAEATGPISWYPFEVRSNGTFTVALGSLQPREYPYSAAVVCRRSELEGLRRDTLAQDPGFIEGGVMSLALAPAGHFDVPLDGSPWAAFGVQAVDVQRNDIDLELLDRTGTVVARDVLADHNPMVVVNPAARATYTLRVKNSSRSLVVADLIVWGIER